MRITIIPSDGHIYVDGKLHVADCSSVDPSIHAVQWYDDRGEVEFKTIDSERKPNEAIDSLGPFQALVDQVMEPPPAPMSITERFTKPVNVIAE